MATKLYQLRYIRNRVDRLGFVKNSSKNGWYLNYLKTMLGEFKIELVKHPFIIIMETIGTVVSMLAAVLLSYQLVSMHAMFLLWIFGSTCLTITSVMRKNILLSSLMIFYLVMNIIGLRNLM